MARGTDTRWDDSRKPLLRATHVGSGVERQSQLQQDRIADREMQDHNDKWFAEQRTKQSPSG